MTLYIQAQTTIARPAEAVWDIVTDYATDTRWRNGITEMTPDRDGPPQVGTKVREVLQLAGRTYVTDTMVTDVGPGMTYGFAGRGTSGEVTGRRTVTALPNQAALFTYDVELQPHTIPRPARPVLRWWLQQSLRRDLRRLRTLLETGALPQPVGLHSPPRGLSRRVMIMAASSSSGLRRQAVYVLDQGQAVEHGTHPELMATGAVTPRSSPSKTRPTPTSKVGHLGDTADEISPSPVQNV